MQIFLMRHGEASHQAPNDAQRPLTNGGEVEAENCASLLADLNIQPDAIFTSPRLRAQQTAQILADHLDTAITISAALDFDFSVEKLTTLLLSFDDAQVICVGHNPSMTDVIQQTTGANLALPTAGLVCLETLSPHMRHAVLRWFITPKLLRKR